MLLTIAVLLIGAMFLVKPLQKNPFFMGYFALMMGTIYFLETKGIYFTPFSKQSFLMFLPLHFLWINFVTFVAYGADKKAAKTKSWRVPEIQLHLLELLGGTPGAFMAQKLFCHKTKKKSFQLSFLFILAIQIVLAYYILNILHII